MFFSFLIDLIINLIYRQTEAICGTPAMHLAKLKLNSIESILWWVPHEKSCVDS